MKALLRIAFLLFSTLSFAQTIKLDGLITDSKNA